MSTSSAAINAQTESPVQVGLVSIRIQSYRCCTAANGSDRRYSLRGSRTRYSSVLAKVLSAGKTWIFGLHVDGTTLRSSSEASYRSLSIRPAKDPACPKSFRPVKIRVACAWRSASITRIRHGRGRRRPATSSPAAKVKTVVVLPTPPFAFVTTILRVIRV